MSVWFLSDPHLYHANFLKFTDVTGALIRPFASVEEMNQKFVDGYLECVKPGDKVYWGGDITWDYGPEFDQLMSKLPGQKRMLLGNHDIIKGTNLMRHFKKVQLWRVFGEEGFVFTHIPLRENQFPHSVVLNVHGHVHQNTLYSPSYKNVCPEVTNWRPVHIDEILALVKTIKDSTDIRTCRQCGAPTTEGEPYCAGCKWPK